MKSLENICATSLENPILKLVLWTILTGPMCFGPPAASASEPQVLLFAETKGWTSLYETALMNRGYNYTLFTSEYSFSSAVAAADPSYNVVVVDSPIDPHDFSSVATFVNAGGRALLQYWDLSAGSSLATAFQVTVSQQITAPQPIYSWGNSTFFTGITSPIRVEETGFNRDGQRLQPASGGEAVAGYVSALTANQAAIVVGNYGRTIVNGLALEDADPPADAVRLIQNELDALIMMVPASPPELTVQPRCQTVVAGARANFCVSASGSLPMNYQWTKDGANLPGATKDTFCLTDVQRTQAGDYALVVANQHGAVTSSVATLTVSALNPVTSVLLFVDHTLSSPYLAALNGLGLPYQYCTDDSSFLSALNTANPAETLVIVDSAFYAHSTGYWVPFLNAGGRAIVQYWNLTANTALASALNVSVVQSYTWVLPVYDWGGSGFFAGLASPLYSTDVFGQDGQKLQPGTGGLAVAGYASSRTANQAALVVGNGGRTIVNAFMLESLSSSASATLLAQNEIQFLIQVPPPLIWSMRVSGNSATLNWSAINGRVYQVQYKDSLAATTWTDLVPTVTATGSTATQTDTTGGAQRFYRVVLLP